MTVSVSFSFVCCVYHLWKGTKSCHQGEQWTSSPLFGWCYLVLLSTAAGLTWPGITYHCCRSHLVRGCAVLWVVAVVVAGAVASSQHQLAVAWLVLSLQVTPSDTVGYEIIII